MTQNRRWDPREKRYETLGARRWIASWCVATSSYTPDAPGFDFDPARDTREVFSVHATRARALANARVVACFFGAPRVVEQEFMAWGGVASLGGWTDLGARLEVD
jgi:hypothetical protein